MFRLTDFELLQIKLQFCCWPHCCTDDTVLVSILNWCVVMRRGCCSTLLKNLQKSAKNSWNHLSQFFWQKLQFDDTKMHYLYHHNIIIFLGVKPLVLKTIYFIKYFSPFKSTVLLHSCYITFHYGCKDCVLHIFVWNQSRNSTLGCRKYKQSGFLFLKNIQYLNQDAKILYFYIAGPII